MKKQVCKTKFINRENEIQILWKEYLLTQNTNKRRTVFISGDYYIGKTALALNFKNILIKENTKLDFINLSFKDSAGITFQDIITRIFVQLDGGDTGKAQKRLQEELSGIISLDELKKMNVIIEKTDKNNKTFRESINLIVELFKRRDCSSSIIILFDDLETCGKIIKEWILEVSEKLKDFPVLIIYSDRDQNDINLFKPKQCLFLDNLPISSAKKMIEQYFPTAKTDPVITSFILQLTRGNPGLIEQYAAFIIEEKIIKVFKDRIRIKTGRVNKVPEKIKEELKSDYSALKPEEKDVLISASIFGESFSSKILSAVFGFDMSLLKKILAGLEEKRFIQKKMSRNREGYFSEIDYKFSYHYKVCLAYDLVPKQKKGKMHAEIAEYLMGKFKHGTEKFYDEILYHFINSGAKEKLNNFLSFYSDYKYREGKLKESAEILSDLVKNLGVTAYKSRSGAENHIKLANILCRTGEQDRGLEILEKLEEKSREIIDTELLPDFLVAKGLLLEEKGLYEQAFGLLKNAYNLIETFSGINPFLLADCINGLGIINNWKGDYNDSIQKFKEVIKLRKELFKKPHPDLAKPYINLGIIGHRTGEYKESIKYLHEALKILLQVNVKENYYVIVCYNNIGGSYYFLKDYDKAMEYYMKGFGESLKIWGSEHYEIAESYMNFGMIHMEKGEYEKALKFLNKCFEIRKKHFGLNHPMVAFTYDYLGETYLRQDKLEPAIDCFRKALQIRIKTVGSQSSDVADNYSRLASVCTRKKEYGNAIKYLENTLNIYFATFGCNHKFCGKAMIDLGRNYLWNKQPENALEYLKKGEKILKKSSEFKQENNGEIQFLIAKALFDLNKKKESLKYLNKVMVSDFAEDKKNKEEIKNLMIKIKK